MLNRCALPLAFKDAPSSVRSSAPARPEGGSSWTESWHINSHRSTCDMLPNLPGGPYAKAVSVRTCGDYSNVSNCSLRSSLFAHPNPERRLDRPSRLLSSASLQGGSCDHACPLCGRADVVRAGSCQSPKGIFSGELPFRFRCARMGTHCNCCARNCIHPLDVRQAEPQNDGQATRKTLPSSTSTEWHRRASQAGATVAMPVR